MISRKVARNALGDALAGKMPTAKTVYPYYPHDFAGESPVVFLSSSGTARTKLTGRGYEVTHQINVHLCVWYGDGQANYNELQAEDLLDQLEEELSAAVLEIEAAHTGNLRTVRFVARSDANETLPVGGDLYLHEIVTIEVT